MDRRAADQIRSVRQVVRGVETCDGAGVRLTRVIGGPQLPLLDPFLMLDCFRSDEPEDYIAGFPDHPHRGFETVTYLLAGRMRHRDNAGHAGVLEAGGVQWMTAGRGIVHSEMPEQKEGRLAGFQLWVNLPASHKMVEPRYQEFSPEAIPSEERDSGGVVKVVAGTTSRGTAGPVTRLVTPVVYFDIALPAGTLFEEPLSVAYHGFVHLFEGSVSVAGQRLESDQLAVLGLGDRLRIEALAESRLLLIAGEPIGEPVARYGPFVMNSEEEIKQAFSDYREGRF